MSNDIKTEIPVIMNKKVASMITYHLTKEKIIYILEETETEIIYMMKSILRKDQTYNIVYNKQNDTYLCDCPAFKFKRRFGKDLCKHIDFIKVLIDENIEIEKI